MAQPSNVNFVLKKDQNLLKFNELDLKITSLPGHAPNQIGIEVDSVYFCADVLFSEEILGKHKIPFFIDIEKTKETLVHIKKSRYAFYVPSHAKPAENMIELVELVEITRIKRRKIRLSYKVFFIFHLYRILRVMSGNYVLQLSKSIYIL